MAAPEKYKTNSTSKAADPSTKTVRKLSRVSVLKHQRGERPGIHKSRGKVRAKKQEGERAEQQGQDRTPTQGQPHTKEGGEGARRQQRIGGERARENQRGCSSALTDVQWGSWNINDEYLSVAEQSNAKPFQSGVEGSKTPHRARPLMPQ